MRSSPRVCTLVLFIMTANYIEGGEVGGIDYIIISSIWLPMVHCWVKNYASGGFHNWENDLWPDTRRIGGNKLRCYRQLKSAFEWEHYLSWVTIKAHRVALARLSTSCHQLEIEIGRHHKLKIPENERLCLTSSIDNKIQFLIEISSNRFSYEHCTISIHPEF